MDSTSETILARTVEIVAAYMGSHHVPAVQIPEIIVSVHATVAGLGRSGNAGDAEPGWPSSAEIRRSVTPDTLTSFLDGRHYRSLRRHLATHGLTPEEYRARYRLPADYPMVAQSYSAQRSALAKGMGLGRKPGA